MRPKLEMYEIPLFPLNIVLFPGMPLPLHIFEERYKEMVADCIRENRPFGVILIAEGKAENGPLATPYAIGCTAEIAQVQPLEEGRMLIMTVGRERFRVLHLQSGKPYLVGMVEPVPLVSETGARVNHHVTTLSPLVSAYLSKLATIGSVDLETDRVPDDLEELVYLAATLIQLPADEKQAFLTMNRATKLAVALERVYRRELALMRTMPSEDIAIFSVN